jgi:hypothetical protein
VDDMKKKLFGAFKIQKQHSKEIIKGVNQKITGEASGEITLQLYNHQKI